MKKQYSKPDILFEDFSLSTSISRTCEKVIDNQSYGLCGLKMGKQVVFDGTVEACSLKITDDGTKYDGWCYHVPIDSKELFNS